MDAQILLRFTAVLAIFISSCESQTISITPAGPVQISEKVVISCAGEIYTAMRKTLELHKSQDSNKIEDVLLVNNDEKVVSSDRYAVNVTVRNDADGQYVEDVMLFTINEVQPEDTGRYICKQVTAGESTEEEVSLTVLDSPKEMTLVVGHLRLDKPEQNHEPLEVDAGTKMPVTCEVKGGNPAPDVKITMAGKDITNEAFIATTEVQYDMDKDAGFRVPEALVKLENKDTDGLALNSPHSEMQLKCEASMHGSDEVVLSHTAKFTFKAVSPTFTEQCPRVVTVGKYTQAAINVQVRSTPAPNSSFVEWTLEQLNKTETLQATRLPDGHGTLKVDLVSGNLYNITLRFDKVYDQAFAKYIFVAKNMAGENRCEVDLVEDETLSLATEAGGADSILASVLVIAGAFLLSLARL